MQKLTATGVATVLGAISWSRSKLSFNHVNAEGERTALKRNSKIFQSRKGLPKDCKWQKDWRMGNNNDFDRHLYFIRHGKHQCAGLNEQGKRQARYTHNWIVESNLEFDEVVVSNFERAQDTWKIINEGKAVSKHLPCGQWNDTWSIEESSMDWNNFYEENPASFKTMLATANFEAGYRYHFVRKEPIEHTKPCPRREMYVFHGNALRYFLFRLLQLPLSSTFECPFHASITKLFVDGEDGAVQLATYSGSHIIPASDLTHVRDTPDN